MNGEKINKIMSSDELDDVLPKYEPIKLSGKNLAQNYVSAFNTGMNIYQCVNYLQGNIDWTIKAVNDVVKSWNTEVSESIDQSKAIVRETTTEQFNTEWTNKQPELIEQVNTLTTNQFNEDWGVLENRINTTLETQNTNIQNIQNDQNELVTNTNNKINEQNTKINSIQTQQNNLSSNQTNLANQQTTLSNRMDTFTSLSEGSTTGDAELKDIRVGANGITYNNAGDAVRGQYSQLKEDLDYLWIDKFIPDTWISGYIGKDGIQQTNDYWQRTNNIPIPNYAKKIKIENMLSVNDIATIVFYKSDDTQPRNVISQVIKPITNVINIPNDAKTYILQSNVNKKDNTNVIYSYLESVNNSLIIEKTKNAIDIRHFIKLNSTTKDITSELQKAVDYCNTNNCALFIPKENYVVSSPIKIYPNTTIIGDNGIIKETGTITEVEHFNIKYTGSGYLFSNSDTKIACAKLKDLILVGNNNNKALLINGHRVNIENCSFVNFNEAVNLNNNIDSAWVGEVKIQNNFFVGGYASLRFIHEKDKGYVIDSMICNNIIVDSNIFIKADFLTAITITLNHDYSKNGIQIDYNASHLVIDNNYFDNQTSFKGTVNGSGNSIRNNTFLLRPDYIEQVENYAVITISENYSNFGELIITGNQLICSQDETGYFLKINNKTSSNNFILEIIYGLNQISRLSSNYINNCETVTIKTVMMTNAGSN